VTVSIRNTAKGWRVYDAAGDVLAGGFPTEQAVRGWCAAHGYEVA
jgi:hypothetical protein